MQIPLESPHSFWFNALLALAGILTGGSVYKLYNTWLARRKIPAEIVKINAEARQISVHADSEISQSMARVTIRLEEMQKRIDQIIYERDELRMRAELQAIELRSADDQMKRMKALLDIHGIKYSEFD